MINLHKRLSGVQLFITRLNLQSRFLLIIGSSALFFVLVIWGVFNGVSERLVERLGARFAEKQVLYDKARTLQPLIREVALARQMADNAVIHQWAMHEQNPELQRQALAEMEKFRRNFQDGSYFLALAKSGHYYFNDASGKYAGKQLRYTLNPAKPADAWFYATMHTGDDYRINIDPNNNTGVTKVWINMVLRDGDKVLGVLGTGLDLTKFISGVADISQPGVTNLFVDDSAAIQIYRDVRYIDFDSIAKTPGQRRSIDQLLDNPEDRVWVRQAINQLEHGGPAVVTKFVEIMGKRYLAGVASLPEVGWFDITLLDLGVLLPRQDFWEIGLIIGGAALGILAILAFTLHRLVLRPVADLTDAAARISGGNYAQVPIEEGRGEVGQLTSQFRVMRDAVHVTQSALEVEVERRTRQFTDAKKILEVALQQEMERREAQTNMLSMMAHEIRSPVAVIGNTTQMLNALAQTEQPSWQPRLEKIMGAVRRLSLLYDNFLAEDRLSAESGGMERKIGDLNAVCAEIATISSRTHGRKIRYEPWSGSAMLCVDWQLIGVAIGNLIDNAVKYSPAESDIMLRVRPGEAGTLCVEVTDRGDGIAPELHQCIFNKFVRGQPGSSVPGTGMGLYLVNWIVKLHGGIATLTSTLGEGSTFCICLPFSEQGQGRQAV